MCIQKSFGMVSVEKNTKNSLHLAFHCDLSLWLVLMLRFLIKDYARLLEVFHCLLLWNCLHRGN